MYIYLLAESLGRHGDAETESNIYWNQSGGRILLKKSGSGQDMKPEPEPEPELTE